MSYCFSGCPVVARTLEVIEEGFAVTDPEVWQLQGPQISDLFDQWTVPEGWLYP